MATPSPQTPYLSDDQERELLDKADRLIKNYAVGSAAVGLIPVPVFDLLGLTALQLKMVNELADLFKVPFGGNLVRSLIGTMIGWTLGSSLWFPLASLIKAIPGIGSLAGGASAAALSYGMTYAMGKVFAEHFAAGGTILTFNPIAVRDYYEQQVEQGLQQYRRPKAP